MQRLQLGEVPMFFVEGPEPATVSLSFRVGTCDEDPPQRGITHLVEHLALFPLGRRDHLMNGFVSHLTCTFYARGTQVEMERFLQELVGSLASLPLDRLESEKRVLQREATLVRPAVVDRLLNLRFGARGYGAVDLLELGLRWLGADEVTAWSEEWFVQRNAALWFHGPAPPSVDVPLPGGERHPPPAPKQIPGLTLPAYSAEGQGGVGASFIVERAWAASVAAGLARERLHDRLRVKEALAYEAWVDYLPLGPEHAHVALGSDSGGDDADRVARLLLEVIDELAEAGPEPDEIDRAKRLIERSHAEDRDAALRELDRTTFEELTGRPVTPFAEELATLAALEPESVRDVLARVGDGLLFLVPETASRPRADVSPYRRDTPSVTGEVFKTKGLRQPTELRIGEEGVSLRTGTETVAIPAAEVAVVVEESDGKLTVVGIDNAWIQISPDDLRDGTRAAQALKALSPGPVVPSDDRRPGRVKEVAAKTLTRPGKVSDELAVLPEILEPEEDPITMAEASRGIRLGLLVLTDRRLVWVFRGRKDDVLAMPRAEIVRAQIKRHALVGAGLRVATEETEVGFTDIKPEERIAEIAFAVSPSGDVGAPSGL